VSVIGLGVIFFVPTEQSTPSKPSYRSCVWRYRLPENIRHEIVTDTNPKGSINSCDLELAAAIVQPDVIATQYDIAETTIASLHDNTPTVFWQKRDSNTTTSPAPYLLRVHTLHSRQLWYISTRDYIPGSQNATADCASRLFELPSNKFLTHFDSVFPQPYQRIG
jgi:hypothetical protein